MIFLRNHPGNSMRCRLYLYISILFVVGLLMGSLHHHSDQFPHLDCPLCAAVQQSADVPCQREVNPFNEKTVKSVAVPESTPLSSWDSSTFYVRGPPN